MDWGTFFTYIAQGVILAAVLFVLSAVVSAVYDSIKGKGSKQ